MTRRLAQAPATLPAIVALALFIVWATDQAGYPLTHWAPGGLIVLALLALTAVLVPLRVAAIPAAVRVALVCLALYTALSFLSILWAGVPGDAWEGADRTLLYLLVFALFACWPQRGGTAALLLCGWTVAMIALAAFTALHVEGGSLGRLFGGTRLLYPTDYPNASAAQWLMAFWPALLLARSERLWWGLRGLLAGGAVLLAAVALLSLSRGSLYATPVMLVLVFALLPGRLRTFAVLAPVAIGVGAIVPFVLRVGDRLEAGTGSAAHTAVQSATVAMFAAALVVGVVVGAAALIEGRQERSPRAQARIRQTVSVAATVTLVTIVAAGVAVAGNPVRRVEHAWQTFKGGYAANGSGNRLVSGLGSNRYDFYRVALDEFVANPVVGIGADNFAEQYLRHGRSEETPHYPHSVELRTLTETGLLGVLLAITGVAAALSAGLRAVRRADALGRAVAAGALACFGYWVVHGSVDWFWEFAGLGAPAFAMLGLACALAPRELKAAASHAPQATGHLPQVTSRASQATGPAPQTADPAPQTADPAPQTADPAPQTADPAPQTGNPAPRATGQAPAPRPAPRQIRRPLALPLAIALTLAGGFAAVALAAPWLSQLQVQSAAHIWPTARASAYARLNDAARLNPLSDESYVIAGSIALRLGEFHRADHEFALALQRVPGDSYATLERGAIASSLGERGRALTLLSRAARLAPRDPLIARALTLVREGRRVDVGELNQSILREAAQLS